MINQITGDDWKIISHFILIEPWKCSAQVESIEFVQGSSNIITKRNHLVVGGKSRSRFTLDGSGKRIFGLSLNRCRLFDVKKLAQGCGPLNQG